MIALLTIPTALAERHYGTNIILTVEQFESTQMNTSNNIRTLSASDDVPQFMEIGTNIDLKNWFYWLIIAPSVPQVFCVVDIIQPMARNYTYSINIPLEYVINASNLTWAEIQGIKSSQNISLTGLLAGSEQFDVPYDDNYTVVVYGNVSGGTCNAIVNFVVDRTSEFYEDKAKLMGVIIATLLAMSAFVLYMTKFLSPMFKIMTSVLSFLFLYMALSISLLAEREYIKLSSVSTSLSNIFTAFVYICIFIASIILVYFVFNNINNILTERRKKRFGE